MAATFETLGAVTGSTTGTDVIGGSNAKSAWTQLSASIGITAKVLWAFLRPEDGTQFIVDIGTGAAASEVVLVPNLLIGDLGPAGAALETRMIGPIPVSIPAGTRVACRAECDSAAPGNETVSIVLLLGDTYPPTLTSWTLANYGVAGGADQKDTTIDPGATIHTKGAWVQLTASSQASIQHAILMIGNAANNAAANAEWLVDIGIGAVASESVVVANLLIAASATGDAPRPTMIALPGDMLSSARISVRAQCDINDATDRLLSVGLLTIAGSVAGGSTIYVGAQNTQVFPVGGGLPSGSRF